MPQGIGGDYLDNDSFGQADPGYLSQMQSGQSPISGAAEAAAAVAPQMPPQPEPSEFGIMIIDQIEKSIQNNAPPEQFVDALADEHLMMLKDISKEELVETIGMFTNSPVINSLRGKRWIENAYDAIQQKAS
jgi:hypothetical protein